jgi:single-strand selective monofunctional uracil DNA glycosylase
MNAQWVVGLGKYAEARARAALSGSAAIVVGASHPSPANPRANQGWAELFTNQLLVAGIPLDERI